MTAAGAAARLDVNVGTLRSWVRHGRATVAGHDEHGLQLFYLDQLTFLQNEYAARKARRRRSLPTAIEPV